MFDKYGNYLKIYINFYFKLGINKTYTTNM